MCPCCKDDSYECEHYLACFDACEPAAGLLGLGLVGGPLYEIGGTLNTILDSVRRAAVADRIGVADLGPADEAFERAHKKVAVWAGTHPWLKACFDENRCRAESEYSGGTQGAEDLFSAIHNGEVRDNLVWFELLVDDWGGATVIETEDETDQFMMSTINICWWIASGSEPIVEKLRRRIESFQPAAHSSA